VYWSNERDRSERRNGSEEPVERGRRPNLNGPYRFAISILLLVRARNFDDIPLKAGQTASSSPSGAVAYRYPVSLFVSTLFRMKKSQRLTRRKTS
jgi:hypothetical protein